ncbi:MAG: FAD-binding oxidoreductase [Hyphomicrobiales bacterium]|nr:FAD-binding oxidoreductase [Hyphomicrobiales bacterium]
MPNNTGADVIVIGGGLAGAAVSWYLAREGVDVLLVERGEIGARASGANAGSIHLQIPVAEYRSLGRKWAETFAPTLSMMNVGVDLWKSLEDKLETPLEFRQCGGIIAARTEQEIALVREKAALEALQGIESTELDAGELLERAPYLAADMIGGAFYPDEGKANPLLVTRAFARAAERHGTRMAPQTEVTGMVRQQAFTVTTSRGRMSAQRVICAAGADAGHVAAMVGLELPIRGYPIQVSVTEPAAAIVDHLVYSAAGKLTLKQMANGTCLIGGGWPSDLQADGTLAVSCRSMSDNLELLHSVVPALAGLQIVRTWPAMVNGNESWRPVVGEAPSCPGFYLCLFPWMGFTGGPIAAHCVADLILGRTPKYDVASLSDLPRPHVE